MNFTNFTNSIDEFGGDEEKNSNTGKILLGVYVFIWICVCFTYIIQRCCFKYRDNVRGDSEYTIPLL